MTDLLAVVYSVLVISFVLVAEVVFGLIATLAEYGGRYFVLTAAGAGVGFGYEIASCLPFWR